MLKPRDIVSGDFYRARKINDNELIFVAADCTGHGVPGAFMSVLGVSMLNEIISGNNIYDTHLILEELRKKVKAALHQTGANNETRDGMDLALCRINTQTMNK